MKIFISQPMRGKTDQEIMDERTKITDKCVRKYGIENVEIVDSFVRNSPEDATPVWYLGESIKRLSRANRIYFADGWKDARGCVIEHEVAEKYGIKIIHD